MFSRILPTRLLFFAAVAIPLEKSPQWTELSFNKIPSNQVSYGAEQLTLKVESSASPLIYKFDGFKKIEQLKVELEIEGAVDIPKDKWDNFEEDSVFRIGLVAKGDNKPSGFKLYFAPTWVQKLFDLAPKGAGIDKIYFLNLTQSKELLGKSRPHPSSPYIHEENVSFYDTKAKQLVLEKKWDTPVEAAALWISADGDDSSSSFTVKIKEITYQ